MWNLKNYVVSNLSKEKIHIIYIIKPSTIIYTIYSIIYIIYSIIYIIKSST